MRVVVLGSAIVLVGALACWAVFGWPSGVNVDPAQEQAMRTSITSYLEERHWRGILAAEHPDQKVRWFCADQMIEVSQEQENYQVGLHTLCQEFTAVDGSLVMGSGTAGPKLATVKSVPGSTEVLGVESAPDGAGNRAWVLDNFSRSGVHKLDRMRRSSAGELETATITKARNAFGLPGDAPVRRPS